MTWTSDSGKLLIIYLCTFIREALNVLISFKQTFPYFTSLNEYYMIMSDHNFFPSLTNHNFVNSKLTYTYKVCNCYMNMETTDCYKGVFADSEAGCAIQRQS